MRSFIVEADGGSRGNPGPAAYGAVVRDAASGEVLIEVAEHIGVASNNVAEYRGLIAGLTAARGLDPSARVEARLDSKLVVEQMSGRWQIKHPSMRPLALQARDILPAGQVSYVWVPRELNKEADRLANEALDAAAAGRPWVHRGAGGHPAGREPETPGEPAPAVLTPAVVDEAEVDVRPQNTVVGWADLGPPTKFLLLRHGETEHTVDKVFSGWGGADPPLTDTGREQARRAAEAVAAWRAGASRHGLTTVHAVVSSPLLRAQQTASFAAAALGVPLETDLDLAECSFGKWEGATLAEVRRDWPDELAAWSQSTAVAPPGGESFDAVATRVKRARDRIVAARPRETVLVVSHVTPIKQLVRLALDAPATALYRMELQPAAFTVLDWYVDGNASLRAFNEIAHLA